MTPDRLIAMLNEPAGPLDQPAHSTSAISQAEAELIDAASAGDQTAFAHLYDRYVDRVYGFCFYRTGHRTDAEDLTQQTFLQAWQAIGRYRRTGAPFSAWLLTISQRLAISHYRRIRTVTLEEALPPPALVEADPADQIGDSIERDHIRAAILQLKGERQVVVLLRFVEDFSIAEVAAVLGKTENNIRVLQHRALADLRAALAEPNRRRLPTADLATSFQQALRTTLRRLGLTRD